MCVYGDPKENILSADAQYELELVESSGHLRQLGVLRDSAVNALGSVAVTIT